MLTPQRPRVLVADDNAVVRAGVVALLEACGRLDVVAAVPDGRAAVEVARGRRVDVALLDVRMPHMGGVEAAAHLSRVCRVLMLTYADEEETVLAALRAGASGFLVHGEFAPAALVAAVEETAAGGSVLSPRVAAVVVRQVNVLGPAPASPGDDALSPRLREVMALMAAGRSNGQIARSLGLTEKTVKNHVNHIFARLGVDSRTAAVARWLGTAVGPGIGPGQDRDKGLRALGHHSRRS